MDLITYKETFTLNGDIDEIGVYLAGKRIGTIQREKRGWRYWPKGQTFGGQLFETVPAVKKSLESE